VLLCYCVVFEVLLGRLVSMVPCPLCIMQAAECCCVSTGTCDHCTSIVNGQILPFLDQCVCCILLSSFLLLFVVLSACCPFMYFFFAFHLKCTISSPGSGPVDKPGGVQLPEPPLSGGHGVHPGRGLPGRQQPAHRPDRGAGAAAGGGARRPAVSWGTSGRR